MHWPLRFRLLIPLLVSFLWSAQPLAQTVISIKNDWKHVVAFEP